MKIHRFFVEDELLDRGQIRIFSGELLNQLKNVLRFKKDENIILFNNTGFDFLVSIQEYERDSILFFIIEKYQNITTPQRETYLFVSIIKKDNFEWIVEKATELGVSHIIPIVSQRTEKKDINRDRLKKIIIESSEQSGRGTLPVLYDISLIESTLENYRHIRSIVWEPLSTKFTKEEVDSCIGSYIGPEGGWTMEEIDLFRKHNVPVRSLGPQVLRTETAVISTISMLVF